jgi:hypothetical protein
MQMIERLALAVGRLDARISVSPLISAWMLRSCWSGYARALQLMGVEIDPIDVFSWGCGLRLPGRVPRPTHGDDYAAFFPWRHRLSQRHRHWAEDLPFTLPEDQARLRGPLVYRAAGLLELWLARAPGIEAWLSLPILLHRLGMTHSPLPCLVGGDRRLVQTPGDPAVRRRLVYELATRAEEGIEVLDGLDGFRDAALAAIADMHRPGALARLVPLLLVKPVQTPEGVARQLGLTLSGAGKLLGRATELGIAVEISGRLSWRVYAARDVALQFGFVKQPRGRPLAGPMPPNDTGDIAAAFDREMADIARRFGGLLGDPVE